MSSSRTADRKIGRMASRLAALAGAIAVVCGGVGPGAQTAVAQSGAQPAGAASSQDKLILKNGQVVLGTIVSESATTVKFKGLVAGIAYETEYQKTDILEIKRAEKPKDGGKAPAKEATPAKPVEKAVTKADASEEEVGAPKVYMIELTGKFGRDISQTPIRDAVKDAQKNGASVLVFSIENDWSSDPELKEESKLGDDAAAFDQLFRAEDMEPIFVNEIPRWEKPPRVVFWVKRAMGGAAFLPLICKEIYFSSDGKIGGVGNLGELMEGVGDDVVRNKQYSLRLGHAEGMAREGDHPYEIVRAMALRKYVLCVSFEGGKVVYHERMPENPGEILLTDDGQGDNKDTTAQLAAGEGNDVLTLNAKLAREIQVSKGTADTLQDLMFKMDVPRNATVVKGRSGQILKQWSDNVDRAERNIRKLRQEVNEVQLGNTFEEHTRGRGLQKAKLNEILGLLRQYGEAFGKGAADGLKAQIEDRLKSIDNEQQREAQQNRKK